MSCVVLFVTWLAVSTEWMYVAMVIVGFTLLALVVPDTRGRRRTPASSASVSKRRRVA